MLSVGFAAFALLSGSQLVGAIRIDESALRELTEGQSGVGSASGELTVGRIRKDENLCTREVVEDAVRCSLDTAVEAVETGLKCGFQWCEVPPLFLCPKACPVTKAAPAPVPMCEILVSCPVAITLHIKGQTNTGSISGLHFEAVLANFEVAQDNSDIEQTINGNKDRLLPMMQDMLDIGLPIANSLLHQQVDTFEEEVVGLLESDIVNEYAWMARLILGGKGFQEGMKSAISQRLSQVGAEVHGRHEVAAYEEANVTKEKLCDRLLRVRIASGEEFFISDWENALVGRSTNLVTNCQVVTSAHCGSGSIVTTTKCPLKDAVVTKKCMFSTRCWSTRRIIKPEENKVTILYRGTTEVETTEKVYLDHVKAPEVAASVAGTTSFQSLHAVPAKKVEGWNGRLSELSSLVQIKDDKLGQVMKDEVCAQLRKNAWYGFGAITQARCRLLFSFMYSLAKATIDIPMGAGTIPADVSLKGGNFSTEFIPDWATLSEAANNAVKAQIDGVALPLGAKVEALNIQLSGDGDTFFVEASPTLSGVLSADKIEELQELFTR